MCSTPCRTLLWPHALCGASAGDHSLVQGLKGDATYLVVTDQGEIEKYGINGVALHPALSSGRCHGSATAKLNSTCRDPAVAPCCCSALATVTQCKP